MIRPMTPSDIPTLRQMYEFSGLPYTLPDLRGPLMESVLVVTDDNDVPVAACASERIIQLYLLIDETLHPAAKLRYIRELHQNMADVLRCKGYSEANCFVPPEMEKSFGRRLMRTFNWVRNWPSFARSF
jgi:hypothetical protein